MLSSRETIASRELETKDSAIILMSASRPNDPTRASSDPITGIDTGSRLPLTRTDSHVDARLFQRASTEQLTLKLFSIRP